MIQTVDSNKVQGFGGEFSKTLLVRSAGLATLPWHHRPLSSMDRTFLSAPVRFSPHLSSLGMLTMLYCDHWLELTEGGAHATEFLYLAS